MKSLLIVNDYPPIGGGQSAYYDYLSRAWPEDQLIVLAPRLAGAEDIDAGLSFPVIRRRYLFAVPILEKAAKMILPYIYAVGIIRREPIRDVHCGHVLSTGVVGLLLKAFWKKEYVVYVHSADILEYRGVPVIRNVLQAVLRHAKHVVANSGFTRGHLIELGVPKDKIVIIHPRIDAQRFMVASDTEAVMDRHGLRGKSVLLSVNRVIERKGNDKVIEALPDILRACPDMVYVVAGCGPDEQRLRDLAKSCEVSASVIFTGKVDTNEIVALYQACDVFVMPSREIEAKGDAEGFGIVYLEANACGKPVVGGRSGGVADAVLDEETGLLVDPNSPDEIARAVIHLLKNPAYATQLGAQGRRRVQEHFDWRQGIPELAGLGVKASDDKAKIKVLHIITRLDPGGSATNTIETVARLDSGRYEVHLLSGRTRDPDGRIEQMLSARGVRYAIETCLQREIHPLHDIRALCRIYRRIKVERYSIVHTHSSKAGIVGRWAAWLAGVPVIVHTPHGHVFYGYFNRFRSQVFVIIERFTAYITSCIINLTEQGRTDHVFFKIAPRSKFAVIPSGIDLAAVQRPSGSGDTLRQSLGWTNDEIVFGTVTRLDPVKGNIHLILAMLSVVERLPGARCILVGEGNERSGLEALARELGVDKKVIFAGFQPDVPAYLQMMDVYVQPSLNEGMGRAILEAMACGLPVIASRVGGIPDIVEDGATGKLIEAGDEEALAETMIAMAEDREAAAGMARRGKDKVNEAFSLEHMVQQIDRLYQDLTKADRA